MQSAVSNTVPDRTVAHVTSAQNFQRQPRYLKDLVGKARPASILPELVLSRQGSISASAAVLTFPKHASTMPLPTSISNVYHDMPHVRERGVERTDFEYAPLVLVAGAWAA